MASKIATDFVQKAEELEKTPQEQSLQSVNDRLKALQESFTKISSKIRKVEVFDAEFKEEHLALSFREAEKVPVGEGTGDREEVDPEVRVQTPA